MNPTQKHLFKRIFCVFLVLLTVFLVSSCDEEKQSDIYKGKECVQCGSQATVSAMGPYSSNLLIGINAEPHGSVNNIYKIFYCEACFDSIKVSPIW